MSEVCSLVGNFKRAMFLYSLSPYVLTQDDENKKFSATIMSPVIYNSYPWNTSYTLLTKRASLDGFQIDPLDEPISDLSPSIKSATRPDHAARWKVSRRTTHDCPQ